VEDELCRLWSEALRLPSVQPDDNVFELGADSLVALQVIAKIEHAFGRELSPIICYEAPTARLLARLISGVPEDEDILARSEDRGLRRQQAVVLRNAPDAVHARQARNCAPSDPERPNP
jgi:acyl carrier protein